MERDRVRQNIPANLAVEILRDFLKWYDPDREQIKDHGGIVRDYLMEVYRLYDLDRERFVYCHYRFGSELHHEMIVVHGGVKMVELLGVMSRLEGEARRIVEEADSHLRDGKG